MCTLEDLDIHLELNNWYVADAGALRLNTVS